MSVRPVLAFFNNKGGVGKTSLVYHLSWMFSNIGRRVLAADLDPQANLTSAILTEDQIEPLLFDPPKPQTVLDALRLLLRGIGDVQPMDPYPIDERFALLPGNLELSSFEDQLSQSWPGCMDRQERDFRVVTAFARLLQDSAARHESDLVLVDLGPSLGAINRAILVATDYVVIPLAPDLFSLQGLQNLGPRLREWRTQWRERRERAPRELDWLPDGRMQPLGYVVQQHSVRLDRPVRSYEKWIHRIPATFQEYILEGSQVPVASPEEDHYCLAMLKHYRSLMPMAQEARKPMFALKPADGAIGAHLQAVQSVYSQFEDLALRIAREIRLPDTQ
jgi:cellulose biosynthesis protein BcsQ